MNSATNELFGRSSSLLKVIEEILPTALEHRYRFSTDDSFEKWRRSAEFNIPQLNVITSLELIDKAHLSAVTALIRTKAWADATCAAHTSRNFFSWAASSRGLIENAGDIVDGLLQIAPTLASNHRAISACLTGRMDTKIAIFSEIEKPLDHFVLAGWLRTKRGEQNPLKAKDNAEYVKVLEPVTPDAPNFYRRLCSICHPSNASIEFMYDLDALDSGGFKLSRNKDIDEIKKTLREFPDVLAGSLMMSCNTALLILRVLHKFKYHPKIPYLKTLDWRDVKMWASIESDLAS
ncbi:hypothetical protein SAMN03159423_2731 [Bradyrhizobium sp. NFR13]|uniref:hypothetical protein n=1 Tax=Bradyrhizobium sp. NFR13 TaxID=1566285 RepID=UPI0008F03415|nr:hypothetical protein [Bradyrhizobium sp. NFR13]SFL59862.1 hypothetical protein SAMN03159423_2731 [Bradyrhizobium sp. NFR13]